MSTTKHYLALKNDITSISNSELVVKKKTVAGTTLLNLFNSTSGQITVKMSEDSTGTSSLATYNLVYYDSTRNAIALLRTDVSNRLETAINYNGSEIDTYCNETFYGNFAIGIKSLILETSIKYINPSDTSQIYTLSRKCFIPSAYELGGGLSRELQDGDEEWDSSRFALKIQATSWATRSPSSSSYIRYIDTYGAFKTKSAGSDMNIRPAFWMKSDAICEWDSTNSQWIIQLETTPSYETTQLDTVRNDDKIYKMKDIDGRSAENVTYDSTAATHTTGSVAEAIANCGEAENIYFDDSIRGKLQSTDVQSAIDELTDDKQDAITTATVTIAVADWNSGTTCTKTVTGVTATNTVITDSSDPTVTATAQAADSLTFTATATPTADVTVKVVIIP